MGEYSFILWLLTSIAFMATMGLPIALTKFIPNYISANKIYQVKQLITRVFLFEIKVSLVVFVLFLIILQFLNLDNKLLYYIISLTLPILILNYILNGFIQGLQKFNLILKINFFITLINLALSIAILLLGKHLLEIIILNFVISVTSLSLSFYCLRDYFLWRAPKLADVIFKDIYKYTISVSLIFFIDIILMERSEVFFLKIFSSIEQVAFYSLSFNYVNKLMILLPGAISGVLMPAISGYQGINDEKSIKKTYLSASRYLVLITLPIMFGGFVVSDLLITILLGRDYLPVVPLIRILLVSGTLSAIVAAASAVLYGVGKQNIILKIGLFAASLNIILDILLIPQLGGLGAALANALAQISGVIIGTYYILKIGKMSFPWTPSLKVLFSSIISAIVIFALGNLITTPSVPKLILSSFVFIIFYITLLMLMKFFNNKDFEILRRIINSI